MAVTALTAARVRDPLASIAIAITASLVVLPVTWYDYPVALIPVGSPSWRWAGASSGVAIAAIVADLAIGFAPLLWVGVGVLLVAAWQRHRLRRCPRFPRSGMRRVTAQLGRRDLAVLLALLLLGVAAPLAMAIAARAIGVPSNDEWVYALGADSLSRTGTITMPSHAASAVGRSWLHSGCSAVWRAAGRTRPSGRDGGHRHRRHVPPPRQYLGWPHPRRSPSS